MSIKPLTRDELKTIVPSAFATHPHESRSNRYSFIPTERIIDDLEKMEWLPVTAFQNRSKVNDGFQAHLIRFRNKEVEEAERYPELVLLNSHNGRTKCKMYGGICELVCMNGLILMTNKVDAALNIMHINYQFSHIQTVVEKIAEETEAQIKMANEYSKIFLTEEQKNEMAYSVVKEVFELEEGVKVDIPSLYAPKRQIQENKNDLWTLWNIVQENVMRGGVKFIHPTNKVTTSREVKNVRKELLSNLALWGILINSYSRVKK